MKGGSEAGVYAQVYLGGGARQQKGRYENITHRENPVYQTLRKGVVKSKTMAGLPCLNKEGVKGLRRKD